jgi:dynein heavy chain
VESKIWTEGILSTIMRDVSRSELDFYEWIIFDGPVDPIWIESMNTVLDENKKLCLTSGEIIKMTDDMKMIF